MKETVHLPLAFPALAARLAGVPAPVEKAGGKGEWEAGYTIVDIQPNPDRTWYCGPYGGLHLVRDPEKSGRYRLKVSATIGLPGGQQDRMSAILTCRADAAGALLGWERRSAFFANGPGPAPTPVRGDNGSVEHGRIHRSTGRDLTAPPPVVANWSLFDTVRRFAGPLSFTMLEELDALRPGQELRRYAETSVKMASGPVRLTGLLQTGDGILPTTWWLTEAGLPLLVLASLRAYIYDPAAISPEVLR
jgi:hypothetical protein